MYTYKRFSFLCMYTYTERVCSPSLSLYIYIYIYRMFYFLHICIYLQRDMERDAFNQLNINMAHPCKLEQRLGIYMCKRRFENISHCRAFKPWSNITLKFLGGSSLGETDWSPIFIDISDILLSSSRVVMIRSSVLSLNTVRITQRFKNIWSCNKQWVNSNNMGGVPN